jgi:hypothetical protein
MALALALVALPSDAGAKATTGVVKVTSKPSGAHILVEGKIYGPTPALIELGSGEHSLTVTLDGYPPVKRTIRVGRGNLTHVGVKFKGGSKHRIRVHKTDPGGEDHGPGVVNINTQPKGLMVFMNDMLVPQPTPVSFDIMSGIYELSLEKDGEIVYQKTVFVSAGRTTEMDIVVRKKRRIDDGDPWK